MQYEPVAACLIAAQKSKGIAYLVAGQVILIVGSWYNKAYVLLPQQQWIENGFQICM